MSSRSENTSVDSSFQSPERRNWTDNIQVPETSLAFPDFIDHVREATLRTKNWPIRHNRFTSQTSHNQYSSAFEMTGNQLFLCLSKVLDQGIIDIIKRPNNMRLVLGYDHTIDRDRVVALAGIRHAISGQEYGDVPWEEVVNNVREDLSDDPASSVLSDPVYHRRIITLDEYHQQKAEKKNQETAAQSGIDERGKSQDDVYVSAGSEGKKLFINRTEAKRTHELGLRRNLGNWNVSMITNVLGEVAAFEARETVDPSLVPREVSEGLMRLESFLRESPLDPQKQLTAGELRRLLELAQASLIRVADRVPDKQKVTLGKLLESL